MFLKKLFKTNRLLFFGMVGFALCQLYINYKVGLTAAPFLHYGMYASPFSTYQSTNVWELEINGERQKLSGYHPRIVEQILEPVRVYLEQPYSNSLYDSHIKRFVRLPTIDSNSFKSHIAKGQFTAWYLKHLERITKRKVNSFKIFETNYNVDKSLFSYDHKSLLLYGSN